MCNCEEECLLLDAKIRNLAEKLKDLTQLIEEHEELLAQLQENMEVSSQDTIEWGDYTNYTVLQSEEEN